VNSDFILNSINKLIFVVVKCRVFFEALRTEFLNIILTVFLFKGSTTIPNTHSSAHTVNGHSRAGLKGEPAGQLPGVQSNKGS
jgi:hypothetical protein